MREINVSVIEDAVRDLCIEANITLPRSLESRIRQLPEEEKSPLGKSVLKTLADNLDAARESNIPICQDTGMSVIFLEIGQDVHFTGMPLYEAVNKGVARGYLEGYLRCSIVKDPIERINTDDNTPAVIHTSIAEGDKVKITVAPKGFGSENMSAIKMFEPSASKEDIEDFAVDTVVSAGSAPCPPVILGVGIGGNFEHCAYLSKKALCRDIGIKNPKPLYSEMERTILEKINKSGIGPQGFGGSITAIAVMIEEAPTHIAGLPVAVNIGCHVTRHAHRVI